VEERVRPGHPRALLAEPTLVVRSFTDTPEACRGVVNFHSFNSVLVIEGSLVQAYRFYSLLGLVLRDERTRRKIFLVVVEPSVF